MIKIFPFIFIILWSSAFVTTKPIIDNSDPFAALAFRFFFVAFGFFIFSIYKKHKILTNLLVVPFFGDVENAKIYILMGNPGFNPGAYIDEVEDENYISLVNQNLKLELKTFKPLHEKAIKTEGYDYWSHKGRIPKITKLLTELNKKDYSQNYEFVKNSICVIESIAKMTRLILRAAPFPLS